MQTQFVFDLTLKRVTAFDGPPSGETMTIITEQNEYSPFPIPKLDEIVKRIEKAAYYTDKNKFVSDILECGAIAISNAVDLLQYPKREKRYKEIMAGYREKERNAIAGIFGMIYALLSSMTYANGWFNDYLGELFMRLNLGNDRTSQFFTPYHVSKLCAKMTVTDNGIAESGANSEILTINDPCCGAGGMALAAMDVLYNDYKVNYAHNCFVVCEDIDLRCVHMTYLQLSLAGVPAIVKHQNTLTRELWSVWETPAYIFQLPRFAHLAKQSHGGDKS